MRGQVAFVSDFGLGDAWVGVCHAVMSEAAPDVNVVDITHSIDPFDVRGASIAAAIAVHHLPRAVHLVVVDPGVGGERRDVAILSEGGTVLVGPDNGVLMGAVRRCGGARSCVVLRAEGDRGGAPTFHARDVLAPAAARLADGASLQDVGDAHDLATLSVAPFSQASVEGGTITAEALGADRFGSVRFSAEAADLGDIGEGTTVCLSMGHVTLRVPFVMTFSDVEKGSPLLLMDSSGFITLAINQGSAVERFDVAPGSAVHIHRC